MGDLTFAWFLSQAARQKASLAILNLGLCHDSLLLERVERHNNGFIVKKPVKLLNKTKALLISYVNQVAPDFSQYNPRQPVCYLYFDAGVKLLRAQDVEELTESQLHALRVRSVHQFASVCHAPDKLYRAKAWTEGLELLFELRCGNLRMKTTTLVMDVDLLESVAKLLRSIWQVFLTAKQGVQLLELDLVLDVLKTPHLLNITRIQKAALASLRGIYSVQAPECKLPLLESEQSCSISGSSEDFDSPFTPVQKDTPSALRNKLSPSFVTMISRTIDKARKKEEQQRQLREAIDSTAERQRSLREQQQFRTHSFNKFRGKHQFKTVEGLIYYLEKTRPRVWARDQRKVGTELTTPASTVLQKQHLRKASSSQFSSASCKFPPLQASLRRSERLSHLLDQEYSRLRTKHKHLSILPEL